MNYTTQIDTVGLQIDLSDTLDQRLIVDELIGSLKERGIYIKYTDYVINKIKRREYKIYVSNTIVASINTGVLRVKSRLFSRYDIKCYISIKFAGLKRYEKRIDIESYNILLLVCSYLNTMEIDFKFTELDICIDAYCKFDNILSVCTRRSPKTEYYGLYDMQHYSRTTYIEKLEKKKFNKAVLRSYTYDKSFKEGLEYDITRFELKLQPKYFNKYGFNKKAIINALNRYYVMYFKNLYEKNIIIDKYNHYSIVREREIKRLGFEKYRLYANIDYIKSFVEILQVVDYDNVEQYFQQLPLRIGF